MVVSALIACAFARSPVAHSDGQNVGIVRSESDINPDGSYHYSFEGENGIAVQEQGQLKANVGDEGAIEAQGSFQYTAPDGTPIALQYVANEAGFQPQGAHLPVAPEVPEQIARALAYIEAHPYVEPQQHGASKHGRF